jgi:hypothetical protein
MKCIDQMPDPIVSDPPIHQAIATTRSSLWTRSARFKATYEAKLATKMDAATAHGSYLEVRKST